MEFMTERSTAVPRKSLAQIRFPGETRTLPYFNDLFDLQVGDLVYVEGEKSGQIGQVAELTYHFKIRLSDYWKVIAVVDTHVRGQFYIAGSHFVTFDPAALPKEQVTTWFHAPAAEDEDDTVFSCDDAEHFPLEDLDRMKITHHIAARGHKYYMENRVRYICLDHGHGYAIVEGTENYTVDFEYQHGEISNLLCDCPCAFNCKHEFATMLQLKDILCLIEKYYPESYAPGGYFAAICKDTLFRLAIDCKETGSFLL